MSEFSVIIPTLQRSDELHELVEQCAAHPLVLEVLVINNAPEPLSWESPKVRVLQQAENIYVNPAWNLGARKARGKYLAIINDDVLFDGEAFDAAVHGLRWFGIVGPDRSNFFAPLPGPPRLRLATLDNVGFGFGTFMAMRREDYVPIPDEMLIWGGDDWLFLNQKRPNAVMIGTRFTTEMSTTSSSDEFQRLRSAERAASDAALKPLLYSQWWHWPVAVLAWARRARHHLHQARGR